MSKRMIAICVKQQKFGSQIDEEFFFSWIGRISDAVTIDCVRDEIWICIPRAYLRKSHLRELVAMAARYRFGLQALRDLEGIKKYEWLFDERKFWHHLL
jgi:hypothetical protein